MNVLVPTPLWLSVALVGVTDGVPSTRHRPGQEPGRRDRHSGRVARGQAEGEGIIIRRTAVIW